MSDSSRTIRLAGVDIGTLTCRLLIADLSFGGHLVEARSERRILRLGEGVDRTKQLSVVAMDRVSQCLKEWRWIIDASHVDAVTAVATSAVRDAENRDEFLDRVKREAGFEVEVISGEEEARRTMLGIRSGLPHDVTDVLALDIGGGSTEFILDRPRSLSDADLSTAANDPRPFASFSAQKKSQRIPANTLPVFLGLRPRIWPHFFRLATNGNVGQAPRQNPVVRSIDIGVVRLCERLLHHDPPIDEELCQAHEWVAKETNAAVAGMGNYQTATFVGTAGTITSLAAMAQKLPAYEPARIHNYQLQLSTIQEIERTLLGSKKADRIGLPGLEKGREEVIAAGAIIIRTVMETLGMSTVLVSDLGLREGVLIDLVMQITER
jgi:exopolyphosphatase/pppGpp-phosphohydrolase